MLQLTSWIHEEFGDENLLERRRILIQRIEAAGNDMEQLKEILPGIKYIHNEIDRLTLSRSEMHRKSKLG